MSWERALGQEAPTTTPVAVATAPAPPPADAPAAPATTTTPPTRRRGRMPSAREPGHRRLDIQGLRAVAVVAVVVDHLTGHPRGGFLGVDVFFVISGFLITGLLLRDEQGHGRISLVGFYRRRVKRLFPAAVTVTLLTVLGAALLFPAGRVRSVIGDGLAATVFGANWRFLAVDTDYFASSGPVSPLRHYWSLSVEEQFYVVWPLTLVVVFAVATRLGADRRRATLLGAGVAAVLLTGVSLVAAISQTAADPVTAYFSTLTRGWELGLGAVLAIVVPFLRAPRIVLTAMSWCGTAVIGVGLFAVTENQVPYPGALWPCLGAALVVAAVSGDERAGETHIGQARRQPPNFILNNRIAGYLGDISYSIYLVHFPVIVFAAALLGAPSGAEQVALGFIIFGASVALYSFVENPLRARSWSVRRRRRRPATAWVTPGPRTTVASAVLALAALTVGFGVFAIGKSTPSRSTQTQAAVDAALRAALAPTPTGTATTPGTPGVATDPNGVGLGASTRPGGPALATLRTQLRSALQTTAWPAITPAFDDPTANPNRGCSTGPLLPADQCTWGRPAAPRTVYLVGDSTSDAYFGAFVAVVDDHPDWNLRLASGAGCPFAATQINDGDGNVHLADCPGRNQAVVDEIQQVKPDLVVVTSSRGLAKYIEGIDPQLAKIRPYVGAMVVLPNGPHGIDPVECRTTVSTPADCISRVPDDYRQWMRAEYALAQKYRATFIDPTAWFCVAGYCPSFVGTTAVRKDDRHMTLQYSTVLGPAIEEALRITKVLT